MKRRLTAPHAAGRAIYLYCRAGPVTLSDPSGLGGGITLEKETNPEDMRYGMAHPEERPPPPPWSKELKQAAELEGEVSALIYQNQKRIGELYAAWQLGGGTVFGIGLPWDFDAWVNPVATIRELGAELEQLKTSGLAEVDSDGRYHSLVFQKSVQSGIVKTSEDLGWFQEFAAGSELRSNTEWALGRLIERLTLFVPGEGAAAGLLADAPVVRAAVLDAIKAIPQHLKKFGKCLPFADLLEKKLVDLGIAGERIHIAKMGDVIVDFASGTKVGEDVHDAIRVGDTVYDNLNPGGVAYDTWRDALRLRTDLKSPVPDKYITTDSLRADRPVP